MKMRIGICDKCKEPTPVDYPCCNAGVWFEGSLEFKKGDDSMVAQSLDEVILKIKSIPLVGFDEKAKGEIRDFLSHEVMKFLGKSPSPEVSEALVNFFKKVVGE
jgi:hypothetical protein